MPTAPFAAPLLAAFLLQTAAPPPAEPPPQPADAPAEAAPAQADAAGTIALPPTGGPRKTADVADAAEAETRIVDLTNDFRKEQGLDPVARNPVLAEAAAKFGRYLAEKGVLGHRAGGTTPARRVEAAGYKFCSVRENLAYQFDPFGFAADRLAQENLTGWKTSPGHRANLLAADVTETGVGVVYDDASGRYFAVQLFALPADAAVTFEVENRTAAAQSYRVAGTEFTLPPRYVRSHTRCSPGPVEVRLGPAPKSDGSENVGEKEAGDPLTIAGGQVLILRPADGGGVEPEIWSPPDPSADGPPRSPAEAAAGR